MSADVSEYGGLANRPDVAKAFESIASKLAADPDEDFLNRVRKLMDSYGDADVRKACRGVDVTDVMANGVPCKYFSPAGAAAHGTRVVYTHGGGWIAGGPTGYKALAATLAKRSNCPVLLVDYRLAPESAFPAGLEDCAAAYEWALDNGPDGPHRARQVCVAGDSAGGNLAAALTIKLLAAGKQPPSRIALLSGVLDVSRSDFVPRHDPIGGADATAAIVSLYAPAQDAAANPLISPMAVSDRVIAQFPPTLIQASADEFLLECNERFARRLVRAGVRTVLSVWPLMPHIWHSFVDLLPEAGLAMDEIGGFFRAHTDGRSP